LAKRNGEVAVDDDVPGSVGAVVELGVEGAFRLRCTPAG
jgi:hypothetical protein